MSNNNNNNNTNDHTYRIPLEVRPLGPNWSSMIQKKNQNWSDAPSLGPMQEGGVLLRDSSDWFELAAYSISYGSLFVYIWMFLLSYVTWRLVQKNCE